MKSTFIHRGDIGTIFQLIVTDKDGIPIDISTASIKFIYFHSPAGQNIKKTAAFFTDGTDGILQYVGIVGDIDVFGLWSIEGYVETTLGKFFTEKSNFTVYSTLAPETQVV